MGITEYDFQTPRTRQDIRTLFERIGFAYKIGKFNAIYNRAKDIYSGYRGPGFSTYTDDDKVSVRAYL